MEWKEALIEDLLTLEYGKGLKNYRHANGQYQVYGTNGPIGSTDIALFDKESIVIGRKGAYRGAFYVDSPFHVIDTAYYVKLIDKTVNVKWLYYWFLDKDVNTFRSGSAIPSTDRNEVYETEIRVPNVHEQRRIARTLSLLDAKIDLLRRQNATLEALGAAVFREWFVEGEWEEIKLGKLYETNKRTITKKNHPEELEYLDTGSVTQNVFDQPIQYNYRAAPSRARRKAEPFDTIYSTVRPNQRHYGIVLDPQDDLVLSTGFTVLHPRENVSPFYAYFFLSDPEMVEYAHSIAEGSTSAYPSLKPSDLESFLCPNADQRVMDEFSRFCKPKFLKIAVNNKSIRQLQSLRDLLLPKLMSGQVIVKE